MTWRAASAISTRHRPRETGDVCCEQSSRAPANGDKPARATAATYRDVLSQLWLLDSVPGWSPSMSSFTRLAQGPKHHLADPALAARLLGATASSLIRTGGAPGDFYVVPRDGPLLGALFESLVVLSVRTYAQAAMASVYHLRTQNGDHEVDIIVEGEGLRVVALEVKLSRNVSDAGTRHLKWLRDRIGNRLVDAVVITMGRDAYRRRDGIAVVPAALLGP